MRQVVHHLADSHMNALVRLKLALTEERPTIKPYDENAWATLADMRLPSRRLARAPRRPSRALGGALHAHDGASSERTFVHPEHRRAVHARVAAAESTAGTRAITSRTSPRCGAREGW